MLFKLSLSTPLNYLKVNSTTTSTAATTVEENATTTDTGDSVNTTAGQTTTLVSTNKQEASAETEYIKVTNEPQLIQIISQPPQLVYVGDIFQAIVLCEIAKNSPVSKVTVSAGILPDSDYTGKLNKNLVQTLI